eukprot:TRINITY_DN39077_c0_g1_i1.p1 TRINITY_DN39077_c0_g1~~TRINITY_DN39077_c0_g1_i1.p1  ORF type:complete len:350 (+),score=88.36 TRINITY_DN39077_c0_g1_i1:1-1050(+)
MLSQRSVLKAELNGQRKWHAHTMMGVGIRSPLRTRVRQQREACRRWAGAVRKSIWESKLHASKQCLDDATSSRSSALELAESRGQESASAQYQLQEAALEEAQQEVLELRKQLQIAQTECEIAQTECAMACRAYETATEAGVQCEILQIHEQDSEQVAQLKEQLCVEKAVQDEAVRLAEQAVQKSHTAEQRLKAALMEVAKQELLFEEEAAKCEAMRIEMGRLGVELGAARQAATTARNTAASELASQKAATDAQLANLQYSQGSAARAHAEEVKSLHDAFSMERQHSRQMRDQLLSNSHDPSLSPDGSRLGRSELDGSKVDDPLMSENIPLETRSSLMCRSLRDSQRL